MEEKAVTICRLCLEDGVIKTMVPLYADNQTTLVGNAVSTFLDIKVNNDNLPLHICKKCNVLLYQSIQFKKKCLSNYEILSSLSKDLKCKGTFNINISSKLTQPIKNNKLATTDEAKKYNIKKENQIIKLEINDTTKCPVINICKKIEPHSKLIKKEKKVDCQRSTVNNSFVCESCGKNFTAKATLQMHLVSVHHDYTKCIVYSCKECPFKCARKLDLIMHMRSHTGERPFVCETCGQAFCRKSVLRRHELIHQEKKISCSHCVHKFYTISDLKSHINSSHIRQFNYQCYLCDKIYAKVGTVRKHLVKLHGVARNSQDKVKRVYLPIAEDVTGLLNNNK